MKPIEMNARSATGALPLFPQPLHARLPRLLGAIAAAPAVVAAIALLAALRVAAALGRPTARPLLGVLVLAVAVGALHTLGVDGPGVLVFALAVGAVSLVLWLLPGGDPAGPGLAAESTWMATPRPDFRMLHLTGQPGLGGAAAWEAAIRFDRYRDDVFNRYAA